MNAERQLSEAYGEWRHLAEVEGEAIAARNWMLVSACQKALQNLQKRISRLSPVAREERSRQDRNGTINAHAMEATVRELIGLERRNQTLLNGLCEAARVKLDELGRAGRNLKQIQRSYGSPHSPAWNVVS